MATICHGCDDPSCVCHEPKRVVTVRMPKSMHERLKAIRTAEIIDPPTMNGFCLDAIQAMLEYTDRRLAQTQGRSRREGKVKRASGGAAAAAGGYTKKGLYANGV